jgi:hypothetical protein
MKRAIIAVIIFVFVIGSAFAFQNEPEGFRGIKWGTNFKDLPGMIMSKADGNFKLYSKKDDKLSIGNATLRDISYGFFKDRFFQVRINFNNGDNFVKLIKTLEEQYGTGDRPNRFLMEYMWLSDTISIVLHYDKIKDSGFIIYFYEPINAEKKEADKEVSRKAAKDL